MEFRLRSQPQKVIIIDTKITTTMIQITDEEKRILEEHREEWTIEIQAQLGDLIEVVEPSYEAKQSPYRYLVDKDYCLGLLTDSTIMDDQIDVTLAIQALRQGLTLAFVDAAQRNGNVGPLNKARAKFRIELLGKLTRPITVDVIKLD